MNVDFFLCEIIDDENIHLSVGEEATIIQREKDYSNKITDFCNETLEQIPGVGPSIAKDLQSLGITKISDLRGKDPEEMYEDLCNLYDQKLDRCLLYVFRCAVYFSTEPTPDHELLKWWNWKE